VRLQRGLRAQQQAACLALAQPAAARPGAVHPAHLAAARRGARSGLVVLLAVGQPAALPAQLQAARLTVKARPQVAALLPARRSVALPQVAGSAQTWSLAGAPLREVVAALPFAAAAAVLISATVVAESAQALTLAAVQTSAARPAEAALISVAGSMAAAQQDAEVVEARPREAVVARLDAVVAAAPRQAEVAQRDVAVAEVQRPAEAAVQPDVAAVPQQAEAAERLDAAAGRLPVAAAHQARPLAAASAPASSVLEVLCHHPPAQAPGRE
jgi:hypothetical protein